MLVFLSVFKSLPKYPPGPDGRTTYSYVGLSGKNVQVFDIKTSDCMIYLGVLGLQGDRRERRREAVQEGNVSWKPVLKGRGHTEMS